MSSHLDSDRGRSERRTAAPRWVRLPCGILEVLAACPPTKPITCLLLVGKTYQSLCSSSFGKYVNVVFSRISQTQHFSRPTGALSRMHLLQDGTGGGTQVNTLREARAFVWELVLLPQMPWCSLGRLRLGKFHAGSMVHFITDSNDIFKSCPGFSTKETISLKAACPSLFCFVPPLG